MVWGQIAAAVAGSAVDGIFSSREASKNRDFQAEYSQNQYQRQVEDLKKAGLNPILAARLGGNAVPVGSAASLSGTGSALSSALHAAPGIHTMDAQKDKLEAETEAAIADKALTEEQTENVKEVTKLSHQQAENARKQGLAMDYENIANAIITKFKQDNPNTTVMQAFGMDGASLVQIIKTVIGGAYVKGAAGAARGAK